MRFYCSVIQRVLRGFDNMESVEKECGALGGLFQAIVNDMKVKHAQIRYNALEEIGGRVFIAFVLFGLQLPDH